MNNRRSGRVVGPVNPFIVWRTSEDGPDAAPLTREVDEENAFPVSIYVLREGTQEAARVGPGYPLPVNVVEDVQSRPIDGTTAQVSVTTTAVLIAAANPFRRSIKITNITGTQVVYLGFSDQVSSTTGDYLHSVAGSNSTIFAKGAIWGLAITSTQTVSVLEESYV